MLDVDTVSIKLEPDVLAARLAARRLARHAGFGATDQARITATASDLTLAIVGYAGSGMLTIRPIVEGPRRGLELVCEGHPTRLQEGASCPWHHADISRLMDEVLVELCSGGGTRVVCRKWL